MNEGVDIDTVPLTLGDLARIMPVIIQEILAQTEPASGDRSVALTEIGSRLLDVSRNTTNPRMQLVAAAIAHTVVATE